ncbi:uncharacterized protein LOC135702857 [Ochlerotatus camptorhynchus]|uniref:uncharacterized protein LOC135702857 n=1 Tax=Ochlerotatus camptorhynchus TaxID=644619 RepID=UPI0031D2E281
MKILLLISALVFGFCSADYSKQQIAEIMQVTKQCYKKLDIPFDSDLIERVMYNRDFPDDQTTKKFINCMLIDLGFWESEGVIDREAVVNFMAEQYDSEKVREVVGKCFRPTGTTQEDKAFNYLRCFFKNKTFVI